MVRQFSTSLAFLAALSFSVVTFSACSADNKDAHTDEDGHSHADEHSHEGAHGGKLVELGTAAHLEFTRDDKTGRVTIYILDTTGKSPLAIADAPVIKLATDSGLKPFTTSPVKAVEGKSSEFTLQNDAFKTHEITGRISVTVDGKVYNPDIEEDHDHEHK